MCIYIISEITLHRDTMTTGLKKKNDIQITLEGIQLSTN